MEGKKNKNFQILGFLSETSSTMNFRKKLSSYGKEGHEEGV